MNKDEYKQLYEQVCEQYDVLAKELATIKQARALDKMAENARELGLDYEPVDGTQVSKVWWDGEKLMAKPIPLEDIYQPVQGPDLIARLKNPEQHYEFTDPKKANAVLMSLCQEAADALAAQQEHEPENEPYVSLASVQEPVQEPVAWMQSDEVHISLWKDDYHTIPLYTAPPAAQRQWVGLTDEEILKLAYPIRWQEVDDFEADRAVNFAQAIEAKLKEKNT